MELKNYTRTIVLNDLEEMISKGDMPCTCEKCKLDVIAIALNSLPSKYVVTGKGECYAKIASYENQMKADVIRAILNAISIVSKYPKHNEEN